MEVTKKSVENTIERKIVSHAIMSTHFLNSMAGSINPIFFYAPFSRTVWKWAEDYFNVYSRAPQHAIQEIFMARRLMLDDDEATLIGMFLQSLAETYQLPSNMDHEIKLCRDWLNLRSLYHMSERLSKALTHNDVVEAQNIVASYTKIERVREQTLDLSNLSVENTIHAFSQQNSTLISLSGAFGKVVGDIKRTDFFNILSPAKMGKSFFLQETGLTAMQQGCRVLELNYEMVEDQRIRRWWTRVQTAPKWGKSVRFPYFYQDNPRDKWKIGFQEEFRAGVTLNEKEIEAFWQDYKAYSGTGDYRLKCLTSKTDTVKDVRNRILNMELYEGWKPDVVIIDHPILLKMPSKGDSWEQVGDLFAELRGLATELDVALITATHSTRAGYKASMLDETQTGKSIDILNHVTACIAITATKLEKDNGFYRASQLVVREGETFSDQCVIASCLDMSMPHIDSRFLSELEEYRIPEEEKKKGD